MELEHSIFNIQQDLLETSLTINELEIVIQPEKKSAAPGLNNIIYILIKHLLQVAIKQILQIYNDIWCSNESKWKHLKILWILKPRDKISAGSYKPISMFYSMFLKILKIPWLRTDYSGYEKENIIPSSLHALQEK